jgi:hypothetical protein
MRDGERLVPACLLCADLTLKGGLHVSRDEGMCLLEAVAYVAGEPHTDRPACVSPVLAAFGRAWNDGMRSDDEREQLKPYIPLLIGTAGDVAADERRVYLAGGWLVRVHAPAWLRLAGLTAHAEALEALPVIDTPAALVAVQEQVEAASVVAHDASLGIGRKAAPVDTADCAAWEAIWATGGKAAAAATRGTAGDYIWGVAEYVASAAATAAARGPAQAAWLAAESSTRPNRFATAQAAAEAALEPTVRQLQQSAHDLFRRMIAAGKGAA